MKKRFTLLTGLLFSMLPLIAYIMHMLFAGGVGNIESFAALVYLPALVALLGQMGNATFSISLVLLGIGLTFGMWFAIGSIVGYVIDRHVPRYRLVITLMLFVVIIVVIAILPILPQVIEYRRTMGIGYSLADCRKIPASLNRGTDRSMCIRTVAVRMINKRDPVVNEQFCNELLLDEDGEGSYCWTKLAIWNGSSADYCEQIADEASRNGCLQTMARKLQDPRICELLRGDRGGTPELCREAMKW